MEAKNEILFNKLAKLINYYKEKHGTPSLIIFSGSETEQFLQDSVKYILEKSNRSWFQKNVLDRIFPLDDYVYPYIYDYFQKVMGIEIVHLPNVKFPKDVSIMYNRNAHQILFNLDESYLTIIKNNETIS